MRRHIRLGDPSLEQGGGRSAAHLVVQRIVIVGAVKLLLVLSSYSSTVGAVKLFGAHLVVHPPFSRLTSQSLSLLSPWTESPIPISAWARFTLSPSLSFSPVRRCSSPHPARDNESGPAHPAFPLVVQWCADPPGPSLARNPPDLDVHCVQQARPGSESCIRVIQQARPKSSGSMLPGPRVHVPSHVDSGLSDPIPPSRAGPLVSVVGSGSAVCAARWPRRSGPMGMAASPGMAMIHGHGHVHEPVRPSGIVGAWP